MKQCSIFLLVAITLFCHSSLKWSDINNKTIETDQGYTGSSYTFITDHNENKIIKIQEFGSGLLVISSHIYICKFDRGSLILLEQKYSSDSDKSLELPYELYIRNDDSFKINDYITVKLFNTPRLLTNNDTAIFNVSIIQNGEYSNLSIW